MQLLYDNPHISQREMAKAAYKLDLIGKSFGALAQLAEAFSKDDEKNAEK